MSTRGRNPMDERARLEKALKAAERYLKKIAHYDDYGHILLPKALLYETYANRALNEIEFIMGIENSEEVDGVSFIG